MSGSSHEPCYIPPCSITHSDTSCMSAILTVRVDVVWGTIRALTRWSGLPYNCTVFATLYRDQHDQTLFV